MTDSLENINIDETNEEHLRIEEIAKLKKELKDNELDAEDSITFGLFMLVIALLPLLSSFEVFENRDDIEKFIERLLAGVFTFISIGFFCGLIETSDKRKKITKKIEKLEKDNVEGKVK